MQLRVLIEFVRDMVRTFVVLDIVVLIECGVTLDRVQYLTVRG